MQLNDVKFAGFLGRDPELFSMESGKHIVTLSVAHTSKYKEKEYTTWMGVKVYEPWAATAELLKKGDNVIISGSLVERKWNDKATGKPRSQIEIRANSIGKIVRAEKSQTVFNPESFDTPYEPQIPIDSTDIPF